MTGSQDYFAATETRRQLINQIHENSTREARISLKVETTGSGVILLPKPVLFDVQFVAEPSFVTGTVLVPGTRIYKNVFPLVTVGVFDWVTDGRTGNYLGAHLWANVMLTGAVVDVAYVKGHGGYRLRHCLVFEAVGMKTIPDNVTTAITVMGPPSSSGL